jgi:hypothetical protein
MYHQEENWILRTKFIYVLRTILTLNSDPLYNNKILIFLMGKGCGICEVVKNLNI